MKHLLTVVLVLQSQLALADRAEDLKQEGVAAARRNDWELARKRFEASYALEPRPLTLYNLAAAEERTDKPLAARKTFAKFLATTKPGEHDKFRALAKTALEKLSTQIPTVRIRITGFAAGMTVTLDGAPAAVGTPIAVDRGAHEAVGPRDAVTVRGSITVDRGERQELALHAPRGAGGGTEHRRAGLAPAAPPARAAAAGEGARAAGGGREAARHRRDRAERAVDLRVGLVLDRDGGRGGRRRRRLLLLRPRPHRRSDARHARARRDRDPVNP